MSYSVRSLNTPRRSKESTSRSRARSTSSSKGYNPSMLKHSISHYGTTSTPLQTQHPLTSSSHSGDMHHHSTIVDPTRFLEGPPTHGQYGHSPPYQPPQHTHPQHSHSKSYLDQSSVMFPSIHNSRIFLDSSRISRTTTKDDLGGGGSHSHQKQHNGIYYSPGNPPPVPPPTHPALNETSNTSNITSTTHRDAAVFRHGILRSLSLLSILSLLLALNSLYFLLQIVSPLLRKYTNDGGDVEMMYEVTLCLSAMCLSINLCVLLVSSAQFFFAVTGTPGSTSFLQKVTVTRGVAIGGFFLSIPIFLSAIVLYTFTHLSFSPPALIATACVGTAIIFGGCSMVHQVFTWQQEKTAKRMIVPIRVSPHPTLELSTLV